MMGAASFTYFDDVAPNAARLDRFICPRACFLGGVPACAKTRKSASTAPTGTSQTELTRSWLPTQLLEQRSQRVKLGAKAAPIPGL